MTGSRIFGRRLWAYRPYSRCLFIALVCAAATAIVPREMHLLDGRALAQAPSPQSAERHRNMPVRGLVRPLNQATVATELSARVAVVGFREGERFSKGDLLIGFDCERQQAEHAAASAQHREMQIALESASYLDKRGAVGRFDVEVSRARLDKAAAEVAALAARLKLCEIRAPFDGRVAERLIHAHEMPVSGKPLLVIVDEAAFEIELIVPSLWLRSLTVRTPFRFSVDELGETFPAIVIRIGAAVDPVSQTAKVIGVFNEKPGKVLPGMSGGALFERNGT
jgi:RND family efflux transporter MFP subunit